MGRLQAPKNLGMPTTIFKKGTRIRVGVQPPTLEGLIFTNFTKPSTKKNKNARLRGKKIILKLSPTQILDPVLKAL